MAPDNAPSKSRSTLPLPLAQSDTALRPVDCRLPPGVRASRIPTASPASVRSLPPDLRISQAQLLSNKIVLGFESEFSVAKVQNWLRAYNAKNVPHLSFSEELPHALYVVEFVTPNLSETKANLLAASPLGVDDSFASVNDYTLTFSPCNQANF